MPQGAISMTVPIRLRAAACVAVLVLSACGEQQAAPAAAPSGAAAVAPPPLPAADPAVVRLYEQTCRACHGTAVAGAPLAGDAAAWAPRVAQGMDTLLDHTINGYKGMPPLGSCGDCGEDEFVALIRYMAPGAETTSP